MNVDKVSANHIRDIEDPVKRLFAFMKERHAIYVRRNLEQPAPWTNDPILRDYRFCNVFRNLDRVTEWIHANWCEPHKDDPDLWFAICVARLLNLPESLEVVGYPVPWDTVKFSRKIQKHRAAGGKCFNAAYIVSTNGISSDKIVYIVHDVLTPLWRNRETLRPTKEDTLMSWHLHLMMYNGMGNFIAAQVVADLKHFDKYLLHAPDHATFVAPGPGSIRGLSVIEGRKIKQADEFRLALARLDEKIAPMVKSAGMPPVDRQDLQNCLCEFSKYMRAVNTGQMPKQKYRWSKEQV
jgi:5-hmdU DNA kinase, helical domain